MTAQEASKNEAEEIIVDEIKEIKDDEGKDTTDWKAEALKHQGIAKRLKTKVEKLKEAPVVEVPKKKEAGLDRIDQAILRVEKITSPEEIDLVQQIMKDTGKDLEAVLASRFFQAELKEMRDLAASKDATPSGTKRAGQAPKDSVEYWIAKGELPKDNPELARKVVNAKLQVEKSKNTFSDNPVV